MIKEQYLHSEPTGKIMGRAMEVHRTLGNGFQEVNYQRALAIEMEQRGLRFSREHEMKIFYKGMEIGTRRVDFFVEQKVMVEIKAVIQLEAYGLEVGLLLNFGSRSLQFKRVMKPQVSGL